MRYLLLYCYFIISPVFAIYDLVSIDITPSSEGTKFCFFLDTSEKSMYLALTENNQDFLFLNEKLEQTPWQKTDIEAPVFLRKKMRPSCFGPFSDETLQNFKLYAGVGTNFDDVVTKQKYLHFFNGFATLPSPDVKKQWTVMVYMVGSDLERQGSNTKGLASKDIIEMLDGTRQFNTNDINVVISTGGSARAGWTTVKRAVIRDGQQYILESLGNPSPSMSEPQTLSDFVLWATTHFPAQHYALILWNHGGGTQGFGKDTSQSVNAKMMSLNQLHQAYQTIRSRMDKPIDIVVYDACLMASIEVAEITATVANAMAASVEIEPNHGIDYTYILNQVSQFPPANGIEFGKMVTDGYIQHAQEKGTFESSQITYSVYDLTQLSLFTETFQAFAEEFSKLLKEPDFLNYQTLSIGIIRAPGYPLIQAGKLNSLRSSPDNEHIRIDLYNVLQTVEPDFKAFNKFAQQLIDLLQEKIVIDYETNDLVKKVKPDAGRISIDIAVQYDKENEVYNKPDYLAVLPPAYTTFYEGLTYYDDYRLKNSFDPDGSIGCFYGEFCGVAQWLKLVAGDVLSIAAYFGQKSGDTAITYLINNTFYQYQTLTEDLYLGVDGNQACQYQICVTKAACENITVTKQGAQLLAEVKLNEVPAVLSFCKKESDKWSICGVAQQMGGIWGRDDTLYQDDQVIPHTLHIPDSLDNLPVPASQLESRQGNALTVIVPNSVTLHKSCDVEKAAIWAMYYGLDKQRQMELLCDKGDRGDCFCKPDDTDVGCQATGFKAGVHLQIF